MRMIEHVGLEVAIANDNGLALKKINALQTQAGHSDTRILTSLCNDHCIEGSETWVDVKHLHCGQILSPIFSHRP